MFHMFAATYKQGKERSECFGPCLLLVHLSPMMYLIAFPWKNNHIALYSECWSGETKKELTVSLKGV